MTRPRGIRSTTRNTCSANASQSMRRASHGPAERIAYPGSRVRNRSTPTDIHDIATTDPARRKYRIMAPISEAGSRVDSLLHTIIRRRFAITLTVVVLALIGITQQVLVMGPLVVSVDYRVHNLHIDLRYPQFYDAMYYLVMIGQRGPTAIVVLIVAWILARRMHNWRPVLLLGFSLLALNLVVGTAKLAIARALPADNTAAVFVSHGIIYPSGHASDVVVTWGIAAYLLVRYGPVKRHDIGATIAVTASLIVGVASIYLDTHWVTDILAGW